MLDVVRSTDAAAIASESIIREVRFDGRLTDWFARISADCPRRAAGVFSASAASTHRT
jgi:hypothetical protein